MRFLQRYVFRNAGTKLLALALSFLLWNTYSSEPIAEVGFQVPIEFINIPAGVEISGEVPTTAHVRVRGRSVLLSRLTSSDLDLHIDLKEGKPGNLLVRVMPEIVTAPFGATVVQVSPSEFRVTLVARPAVPVPAG